MSLSPLCSGQYRADLGNHQHQHRMPGSQGTAVRRRLGALYRKHILDLEARPLTQRLNSFPPGQALPLASSGVPPSPRLCTTFSRRPRTRTRPLSRLQGAGGKRGLPHLRLPAPGSSPSTGAAGGGLASRGSSALKLLIGPPLPGRRHVSHVTLLGPRQRATDFNPRSHVDFGDAAHPVVGGGTHYRRATRGGLPSADIGASVLAVAGRSPGLCLSALSIAVPAFALLCSPFRFCRVRRVCKCMVSCGPYSLLHPRPFCFRGHSASDSVYY
jgi:hypothetical protein